MPTGERMRQEIWMKVPDTVYKSWLLRRHVSDLLDGTVGRGELLYHSVMYGLSVPLDHYGSELFPYFSSSI